ncbi:hypothetical protein EVAR_5688_1 [Eumeta japonica]|uniref:Uncharacterized protein n=1 Tax=Eumeta variegata TaxID=151549 RepID=A0A4C1TAD1_EUMVA|nr:hypothetical protein EVAR_5688_1 [Eumeta japonica]
MHPRLELWIFCTESIRESRCFTAIVKPVAKYLYSESSSKPVPSYRNVASPAGAAVDRPVWTCSQDIFYRGLRASPSNRKVPGSIDHGRIDQYISNLSQNYSPVPRGTRSAVDPGCRQRLPARTTSARPAAKSKHLEKVLEGYASAVGRLSPL